MPNALDEVTGGVPKAPTPPAIEDVLGPPPHAPLVGRRGHALALAGRYRRPPSPPHIGRRVSSESSKSQGAAPQKVVVEQRVIAPDKEKKHPLSREYAPEEPEVSQFAGRPIGRKVRQAAAVADKINPFRKQKPAEEEPSAEPRPENVQAHHDETRRQVDEAMDALRKHQERRP